jgi:hypothetical protein
MRSSYAWAAFWYGVSGSRGGGVVDLMMHLDDSANYVLTTRDSPGNTALAWPLPE